MGEADDNDKEEGNTTYFLRYLVERLKDVEAENKKLRASESRLRQHLEFTLSNYEDTEREAQTIRDLLYSVSEDNNGSGS